MTPSKPLNVSDDASTLGPRDLSEWGLQVTASPRRLPGMVQDAASVLDLALDECPDDEAVVGRHTRLTYRQFEAQVNGAAAGLTARGLRAGDHVACSLDNHPELLVAFLAIMRLGGVWIGMPPKLTAPEKAYILKDSEAKAFLARKADLTALGDRPDLPDLDILIDIDPAANSGWTSLIDAHAGAERVQVAVDPGMPAAIAYTSGTTGFPKGAVHSQHNIVQLAACCGRFASHDFFAPKLRVGIVQPAAILNVIVMSVMNTWMTGGVCVLSDRVDALGVADWIEREAVQAIGAAPATMLDLLSRQDISAAALASLEHVAIGGGPCPEDLRAKFTERFGRPPIIAYGLTEAPGQVTSTHADQPSPLGASGYAHPLVTITVRDEAGDVLPVGRSGEICVDAREDGPCAGVYTPMLGYWKKPEATAKALAGGVLHTGDFGSLDEGGHLTLTGRLNDVIIRGGGNVYPAEVERILGELDLVRAVAVVGRPDPRLGETVEAFVQLAPGSLPSGDIREVLAAHCRANLAGYKVPLHWNFVDEMPRNSMQKIAKARLREMAGASHDGS